MTNTQIDKLIDELSEQLNDKNSEVREEAAYKLGKFKEDKARNALEDRLSKEDDVEVRLTAINSLGEFSSSQEAARALISRLISELNNNLRAAIVKQFANFDFKEVYKALLACLINENEDIFVKKEALLSARDLLLKYPLVEVVTETAPFNKISPLNNLVNKLVKKGWQIGEEIYEKLQPPENFQGLLEPCTFTSDSVQETTKRVNKSIKLGIHSISLLISLKYVSDEKFQVSIKVKPYVGETYLPTDLEIHLISSNGEKVNSKQVREQNEYIKLKKFSITSGNTFYIKVSLDNIQVTETVEI